MSVVLGASTVSSISRRMYVYIMFYRDTQWSAHVQAEHRSFCIKSWMFWPHLACPPFRRRLTKGACRFRPLLPPAGYLAARLPSHGHGAWDTPLADMLHNRLLLRLRASGAFQCAITSPWAKGTFKTNVYVHFVSSDFDEFFRSFHSLLCARNMSSGVFRLIHKPWWFQVR